MLLKDFLETEKNRVEKRLETLLSDTEGYAKTLCDAMRYSVMAGGKRLRPCLFLATAEACGGDKDALLDFACALELIHTYSLIHDDLPAMDNDDLRRGKPTCHKVYGEAQAILAGDGLLTYAFQVMSSLRGSVDDSALLDAIHEVASSAGMNGMVIGQAVDVEQEGQPLDEEILHFIHRNKTGALFSASIVSAAILCKAEKNIIAALREFSLWSGIAFQIADDLLDVRGDAKSLGKTPGSDIKNNKTTYVTLFGITEAEKRASEAANKAIDALAPLGEKGRILSQIPAYFIKRTY